MVIEEPITGMWVFSSERAGEIGFEVRIEGKF